jgi:hypothetical protein
MSSVVFEEIKEGERVVAEGVVRRPEFKQTTGYPYNLSEEQIVRMIYFFGSRRLKGKALGRVEGDFGFDKEELRLIYYFFNILGIQCESQDKFKTAYRFLRNVFKNVIQFLRTKPAYLTKPIYDACKVCGYQSVYKNVVLVLDDKGNLVPRLAASENVKKVIPIGNVENLLWEIQNVTLDKMLLIAQSISPKDIRKANLGMKSKAFRDLFAAFHMARLQQKNPNLTLVNVNVNTSDSTEKLKVLSAYVQRNREEI